MALCHRLAVPGLLVIVRWKEIPLKHRVRIDCTRQARVQTVLIPTISFILQRLAELASPLLVRAVDILHAVRVDSTAMTACQQCLWTHSCADLAGFEATVIFVCVVDERGLLRLDGRNHIFILILFCVLRFGLMLRFGASRPHRRWRAYFIVNRPLAFVTCLLDSPLILVFIVAVALLQDTLNHALPLLVHCGASNISRGAIVAAGVHFGALRPLASASLDLVLCVVLGGVVQSLVELIAATFFASGAFAELNWLEGLACASQALDFT